MIKTKEEKDCSNLVIKKFHFLFLRMRMPKSEYDYRTQNKNGDIFVNWMIKKFKKIVELEKDEKYNATAMYMNKKNIDKLRKRLPPILFLDIAPKECDELKNNEIGIKIEELIK